MIRRADNVGLFFQTGTFSRLGWVSVRIGRQTYRIARLEHSHYARLQQEQRRAPVFVLAVSGRNYWQFQDRFFWENEGLNASQVYALVISKQQRERARIERAEAMMAMGWTPQLQENRRDTIPDDVKQFVFTRDGGRCRHCSSQASLQYDHIIPVAMGGSSEPENLQLLCAPCNRRKGAGLTVRF